MEVVVFGAGSLGSLVGGVLARHHEVTLVGRPDHVAAVNADGLRLSGELDDHVWPTATTDGTGLTADLAVVTVKSTDTATAAETLATGTYDAAVSLQNGMGNEAQLAEALSCPVLAGTATYGAVLADPGHVRCTGVGEVVVGARDGGPSPVADRVGEIFTAADLETTVATDMPRRLWTKLAVNAGINPVTAISRRRNGAVCEPPLASVARAAARETAQTARAHDVALSDERALTALRDVATATASNTSSMLQDVRAGRQTEIDAICGYVVDRADAAGIDVPTNRLLAALVGGLDTGD